ncbi:MAG: hypothetical protein ABR987_15230 [Terracidiphilus sp.]
MPRSRRTESVFLNIPYDLGFEDLYLAYIVGLTQLGLRVNATVGVPNQGRLETIIGLIEESNFSIHDLSRIELSKGIPRFNMPVELGLALYRSHVTSGRHRVYVFESKPYRTQRSTSDINGIDPQIHNGTAKGIMAGLRNILRQPGDVTSVPEMITSYRAVRRKLSDLRLNAGGQSLFQASVFHDLVLAALVESQKLIEKRARTHRS